VNYMYQALHEPEKLYIDLTVFVNCKNSTQKKSNIFINNQVNQKTVELG